jgi:hypothetical protein
MAMISLTRVRDDGLRKSDYDIMRTASGTVLGDSGFGYKAGNVGITHHSAVRMHVLSPSFPNRGRDMSICS